MADDGYSAFEWDVSLNLLILCRIAILSASIEFAMSSKTIFEHSCVISRPNIYILRELQCPWWSRQHVAHVVVAEQAAKKA